MIYPHAEIGREKAAEVYKKFGADKKIITLDLNQILFFINFHRGGGVSAGQTPVLARHPTI